jgi:hypothetical protein
MNVFIRRAMKAFAFFLVRFACLLLGWSVALQCKLAAHRRTHAHTATNARLLRLIGRL